MNQSRSSSRRVAAAILCLLTVSPWSCSPAPQTRAPAAAAPPTTSPATAAATAPAPLRIVAGPYLQSPATSAVTVAWFTNRPCASRVECGTSAQDMQPVRNSRDGLIDANTTLHAVRLTGLRPGTRYRYRVVSTEVLDYQPYKVVFGDTVQSDEHEFTTLDEAKRAFAFVALTDRHEKVDPLKAVLRALPWSDLDFVVFSGDMVNHAQDESQLLTAVVRPTVEFFAAGKPFIYVRGNHDARGRFARELLRYFPTPEGRFYHGFSHGGVRFTVLDTGEDKADSHVAYSGLVDFQRYLDEQTQWLAREVESPAFRAARFRVVLCHIPPTEFSHKPELIRLDYLLEKWRPLLNAGKVDLVLCGHTHNYRHAEPVEGKQGYHVVIGAPDKVTRVDVSESRLRVSVTKDDGTAVESFAIERRPAGTASAASSVIMRP